MMARVDFAAWHARFEEGVHGQGEHCSSHQGPYQPRGLALAIPTLLRGGTEVQTLSLTKVLTAIDHSITIIVYFEADPRVVADFQHTGAQAHLLSLDRASSAFRLVAQLRRFLKQRRAQLLHVQYMAPGLQPILAARLAGIRNVIATVHQPATPYGSKARILLRCAARLCRKFTCVSEAVERSWFGDSHLYEPEDPVSQHRRHVTIPNAVDLDTIASLSSEDAARAIRSSLGLGSAPVIGVVSRLRREKGIDVLVQAMPAILHSHPDARLLIVGDGPDARPLGSQAETLGVSANCLWVGNRPWEEAMRFVAAMDVVVVPSRFEGFGLSAAEAMAAGRAVVASDVDGLAEVAGRDGAAVLVPPGDAVALARTVTSLLARPDRMIAIGNAARRRIQDQFSFDSFRRRILGLYRELLPSSLNLARISH